MRLPVRYKSSIFTGKRHGNTAKISTKCLIVNEISKQICICTSVEVISSLQTVVIQFFYFSFIIKFNSILFQVYVIKVSWSDASVNVIYRRYSKFFDLQVCLRLTIVYCSLFAGTVKSQQWWFWIVWLIITQLFQWDGDPLYNLPTLDILRNEVHFKLISI